MMADAALALWPIPPRCDAPSGLHERHGIRGGRPMETRLVQDENVANAIAAIGTDTFGSELDTLVDRICGVDFCACYRIDEDSVDVVALSDPNRFESAARIDSYAHDKLWETDPALSQAYHQLASNNLAHARLRRSDISDGRLRDVVYTHLVDRLLICHKGTMGVFAMSLLRWRGSLPFQLGEIDALLASSPVIMALVDRHFVYSGKRHQPTDAFLSLQLAERCFEAQTDMPARECEVCARIVFGQSLPAIASDLRISVDTVKSYVKRAYQRLGIASQRDLMVAYLQHWSAWLPGGKQPRRAVR
jgi:DNA-binding CsgD family transcriptional regulator